MYYHEKFKPEELTPEVLDQLLALGWYRMKQTIFSTSHIQFQKGDLPLKVIWLRYAVDELKARRSHKKISRRNTETTVELLDPFEHAQELDELYQRYFESIDFDGYPNIPSATFEPGEPNIYDTKALVLRREGKAIACGIFDTGEDSAASILHFYDPAYRWYSPGKYLMLLTVEYCRQKGISWYYPGYLVQGNRHMDYKLFLGPEHAQCYVPDMGPVAGRWVPFQMGMLDMANYRYPFQK
jgi:arginyl-tRNA--protein-N-Asp/Glu arginylyltransferase